MFQEARYGKRSQTLPSLISGSLLAQTHDIAPAYVLIAQLALMNYQGPFGITAERAQVQARLLGNPVVVAGLGFDLAVEFDEPLARLLPDRPHSGTRTLAINSARASAGARRVGRQGRNGRGAGS
ncbi:hypothetical protein [Streptomyces sp. NBC_00158]|uniref:hypothetical protein n=1 Tax=Streptomyces sp. NBC_00158 TaxID=2903627 RepID=UPI0032530144